MDFTQLQAKIHTLSRVDIGAHIDQFRRSAPQATAEACLLHLRRQGVIDIKLFKELHMAEAIDATSAPQALRAPIPALNATEPAVAVTQPGSMGPDTLDDADPPTIRGESPSSSTDVDHYEVLGELGKGAMGEVHLARDLVLRRKVALKSILPNLQQSPALFSRFLGEMQITAQLDHPSIVPVYGVETGPSGGLAYAMKLVQGKELQALLNETKELVTQGKRLTGPYTLEARLEAFLKICDALAYAHERGVVHRDLKPANVMLGSFNEVYVMDWGIARIMGSRGTPQDQGVEMYDAQGNDARQTARTRLGSTLGTPIYMSPEQAAGKNEQLDGRSDLYSLGLMLQEIVTLSQAMGGTTLQEVLTNAKDARRLPVAPAVPGIEVPREIRAIIERATQREPNQRYAKVSDLAEDVRRYLRNEEVLAEPDTYLQAAGRWFSQHRMLGMALIFLTLFLGSAATIGVLVFSRNKLEAKHNRELHLAELQASASRRAQDLDATLQHYEKLLARMSGATGLAIADHADAEALHPSDHFDLGPNAVSGLVDSSFYGKRVSFDWPVSARAPDAVEPSPIDQATLYALRKTGRGLMLQSLGASPGKLSEDEQLRALLETGVPLVRVTVTLESGLMSQYPGMVGLDPNLDGRKEPLYQRAKISPGVVWGAPAQGPKGSMLLPCASPLRDAEGQVYGVIAFDIDPTRAIAAAIETGGVEHIESSLLVERTGRILAQRSADGAPQLSEMLEIPEIREAIARGETGYRETRHGGHDVLVTYQPLSSLEWYLVTIANVDKVERAPATTRPGSVGSATSAPLAAAPPQKNPSPPKMPANPPPQPTVEESASAAPSSSAPPPAATSAKLWGKLPTATPSAAPSAPPPNPFDPWKAYEKKKPEE
ncbi:MAG: protein kinase [Polyangiaceae bacterium]|nr:protein kinase [Polyangiaceae bacterium]